MNAPTENLPLVLMKPTAPAVLMQYHDEITNFIKNALKEGVDYGTIPGTTKETLYKAGAERINIAFGTHPEYVLVEKEADHEKEVSWRKEKKYTNKIEAGTSLGVYRYVYKCKIVKMDGTSVGEGDGVCSTMESKYIDRPRDSENTVCKMSQKRAYIGATLNAFGLSNRFTQSKDDDDSGNGSEHSNTPKNRPVGQIIGDKCFVKCEYDDKDTQAALKAFGSRFDGQRKEWWFLTNNIRGMQEFGPKNTQAPQAADTHGFGGDDEAPPIDDSGMPPY